MKKLSSEELKTIIIAVLLMVIGILFCCSLSIGIEGLSVVIGLILLIVGILFLINCFVGNNGILGIESIVGIVLLALGIMFMIHKLAGLIFAYIPWLLIIFGIVEIGFRVISSFKQFLILLAQASLYVPFGPRKYKINLITSFYIPFDVFFL